MKRALVIRLSSLGDVVLASSVIEPLKRAGYRVEFLTFRPFGELFRNHPGVSRVLETSREELRGLSNLKSFAEGLKGYDAVFDLQDNLRTKLMRPFIPAKVFVYPKGALLRRLMVVFKPFKAKWLYVPELYGEALKRAGIGAESLRPKLYPGKEELNKVKKLLPAGNAVAVAPGAKWEGKRYPVEKFKEVVKLLKSKGFTVLVVGGREEFELGEALKEEGAENLCGKLSLSESLALLSLVKGVISNDSAVVHMARAVKTPVVAVFGPTHPAFGFAPYPDEGVAVTLNLPCSPCSLHGKTSCTHRRCFNIEPERVVGELLRLVESGSRKEEGVEVKTATG